MIFTIFAALVSESDPPKTVKSCANAKTWRPSIEAVAGDDAVSRRDLLRHAEVVAAVCDELVDLLERARIEQQIDSLAGGELAGGVLALQAVGASAQRCAPLQIIERLAWIHWSSQPSAVSHQPPATR